MVGRLLWVPLPPRACPRTGRRLARSGLPLLRALGRPSLEARHRLPPNTLLLLLSAHLCPRLPQFPLHLCRLPIPPYRVPLHPVRHRSWRPLWVARVWFPGWGRPRCRPRRRPNRRRPSSGLLRDRLLRRRRSPNPKLPTVPRGVGPALAVRVQHRLLALQVSPKEPGPDQLPSEEGASSRSKRPWGERSPFAPAADHQYEVHL